MKVIGITGPTGAGKTTALNALVSLGGYIIDADEVYHDLTLRSPALREDLVSRFGPVYEGNVLDRKRLGTIVFQDPAALEDLNGIIRVHMGPEIEHHVAQAMREGREVVGLDAIALVESGLKARCHCTVAVVAPEALRIRRIMAREGIPEEYARLRVRAQKSGEWFREHCDYAIENTQADTVESFSQRALDLFRRILEEI